MELIDYIDRLFIYVPRIPDYWITARLNTAFKGHASIWYPQMEEIHGRRVKLSKSTAMANSCQKEKKKVYGIEKFPEEQSPPEDSESDSMGDAFREQSYDDQAPREEFLVEDQEETPLEIQDIQLEAGVPQDTANKSVCKHTQDAQTFLVTPAKEMAYIHGTATDMTFTEDAKENRPAFAIGEEPSGKIRGHDIHTYLDVGRSYPPMLGRPLYPACLETRKEIEKHVNEVLDMDVIRKIGHNDIVKITTPVLITWNDAKSRLCGDFRALNNY
ncbi:hypothetical protein O181_036811 [Austropuccinia psidii MF-1]|uniref:Uncharacterized protein n=1 Tax=Austropuccinia psidii MF-1 TaxID=1389203 RepID=A0A9Q3HA84_9BASI|nr:hypothetical protein [Austropuccinia psidii MF-1]